MTNALVKPEAAEEKSRRWSLSSGKTHEAAFVSIIAGKAVLKNTQGKLIRIPLARLSTEDQHFIELCSPPDFKLDFAKTTCQRPAVDPGPYITWRTPPKEIDCQFTAKVRQSSPNPYNHALNVEFFVFADEIDGDNYILLDRQSDIFVPNEQNNGSHSITGSSVLLFDYYDYWGNRRGQKYGGHLITLTDSRGKIIAHRATHKWLFSNLEKLREFPVGRHFDKDINRTIPPRPKRHY